MNPHESSAYCRKYSKLKHRREAKQHGGSNLELDILFYKIDIIWLHKELTTFFPTGTKLGSRPVKH